MHWHVSFYSRTVVLLAHHWRYHSLVFRFPVFGFLKFYYRATFEFVLLRIYFSWFCGLMSFISFWDFCHYFFKYNSCPVLLSCPFGTQITTPILSFSHLLCPSFPYFSSSILSFLPSFLLDFGIFSTPLHFQHCF